MPKVQLTKGKFTFVDRDDISRISNYKWKVSPQGYAVRTQWCGSYTKHKTILMHREILRAPNGKTVDHRDGNPLNNRKRNLRVCSFGQNLKNMKKPITNTSGYKGVVFAKWANKFRAQIDSDGVHYSLGYYNTAEDAFEAYKIASKILHGEFSKLE